MLKNHPYIKWILIALLSLGGVVIAFGFWLFSLIPDDEDRSLLKTTKPEDLSYLASGTKEKRGKILAVVSSHERMGPENKKAGYELTELARPYYVFQANGFEVDVASPLGGTPPKKLDGDDMGKYDYAFLNDFVAQQKVNQSIAMKDVKADEYDAVYFVGGKGAMFDFPENGYIQAIVSKFFQEGKVIGAVCHGPAALINVTDDEGRSILDGKEVSCFTNDEELLLLPNAKEIFGFLLEDKLVERGGHFTKSPVYLQQISHDGNLITGQNPWSVWALAEAMVRQLGYEPVTRPITAQENAIRLLSIYESQGRATAAVWLTSLLSDAEREIDRNLLTMHIVVAAMQWDLLKSVDILRLLAAAKPNR